MNCRIMSRDLSGIRLDGPNAASYYSRNRSFHIDPKYVTYGDVLMRTKRIVIGISIETKFQWRGFHRWDLKPQFRWRYGNYDFGWLFFRIKFDKQYRDVNDVIIEDHLAEQEAAAS